MNATNAIVGAVLREIRDDAGLTLVTVENRSRGAVTACRVASYERGEKAPKVAQLIELCQFYEVSYTLVVDIIATRTKAAAA